MEYIIPSESEGKSVLEVIREDLGISRSTLKRLKFREGGITLCSEQVTVRKTVRAGDVLSLDLEDRQTPASLEPCNIPLDIIYEDEDIAIPNKPPYMPTHQSHGHYTDTVANALAYKYAERGVPFVFRPINRLDKNTSGLLIIAKNIISAAALSESMKRREIKKTYIAILDGRLGESEGVIDMPIRRAEQSIIFREVCAPDAKGADSAVTEYRVIDEIGAYTLVSARPITGRTHQLRVHFAHLGAPILGDDLYGRESELISRHALHAGALEFVHPSKKEQMAVHSVPPSDMMSVLCKLGFDINKLKDI